MAEAKRNHPDRFLWCAVLPQPNVGASVDEAVFALDSLGADGIKLATSVDGVYLGDSYDLAGGPSNQAVKMLLTITTPDHIMFGTDYPFVPTPILEKVAAKVKNEIIQDPELRQYAGDIIRNNAMKLFK